MCRSWYPVLCEWTTNIRLFADSLTTPHRTADCAPLGAHLSFCCRRHFASAPVGLFWRHHQCVLLRRRCNVVVVVVLVVVVVVTSPLHNKLFISRFCYAITPIVVDVGHHSRRTTAPPRRDSAGIPWRHSDVTRGKLGSGVGDCRQWRQTVERNRKLAVRAQLVASPACSSRNCTCTRSRDDNPYFD